MIVSLPRLADRSGDVWLLAEHFLGKYNQSYGKKVTGFSAAARERLARYDFPGNVRELENIVARAVGLAEGQRIEVRDLPPALGEDNQNPPDHLKSLEDLEKEHIARVLAAVQFRRDQAADILGITRSTLWRKIRKYGLEQAGNNNKPQ